MITGLHVEGVDQSSFIDGVIAFGLGTDFDSPQAEAHQLGGKDVFQMTDAELSQSWEMAYVYGVGETVWVLRGRDELLDALLATMP